MCELAMSFTSSRRKPSFSIFALICGADWVSPASMRMCPSGEVIRMEESALPTYQVLAYTLKGSCGRLHSSQYSQACGGSALKSAAPATLTDVASNRNERIMVGLRKGARLQQRFLHLV